MYRCLGIATLCLAISISVRYGVPEPLPKKVPHSDGNREVAEPDKKEANKSVGLVPPGSNLVSQSAGADKADRQLEKPTLPDGHQSFKLFVTEDNRKTIAALVPGSKVDVIFTHPAEELEIPPQLILKDLMYVEDDGDIRVDGGDTRAVGNKIKVISVAGTPDELLRLRLAVVNYAEARVVLNVPSIGKGKQ